MMKYLIIISLFASVLLTAADKNSVFNTIKEKYANPESVILKFEKENDPNLKGEIIASGDNKYRITVPGRIITCNGKTIWNYSYNDKNVIISNFHSHSESASPERIFFDVLESYEPASLKKLVSTKEPKTFELTLTPQKDKAAGMSKIVLWLDDKYNIVKIGIESLYGFEVWRLLSIKIDVPVKQSEFAFTPPEDTEIIDLR